ncbi:MAG: OmpH family outer membrane protein [Bacteroidales bacterium]|nr:OmpH family outer membrane protein [Bacteroidales bacterium]
MKKGLIFIALSVLVFTTLNVSAQSKAKFGHIDFAVLYAAMPGQDSIKTIFEQYTKDLQDTFASMTNEYQTKLQDYQANMATMSNLIRQNKEREIMDIQTRMEDFRTQAEQDLQQKELELTTPIIDKARQAVSDVAKENGYTYVFNSSEGLLLYSDPSDDILPLVKKKLNIQ